MADQICSIPPSIRQQFRHTQGLSKKGIHTPPTNNHTTLYSTCCSTSWPSYRIFLGGRNCITSIFSRIMFELGFHFQPSHFQALKPVAFLVSFPPDSFATGLMSDLFPLIPQQCIHMISPERSYCLHSRLPRAVKIPRPLIVLVIESDNKQWDEGFLPDLDFASEKNTLTNLRL